MSYIDPSQYNQLLKNFAKGTPKQILSENYIDLRPVGSLDEYASNMVMSTNDAKYPGSMEEADLSPKQQKIARMAPPEDKITGADFAAMKKDEGMHLGQPTEPTMQTVEGMSLGNLSLDERNELKAYVESIKTTKKAIQELLEKAKTPKMEGGDMSKGQLQVGQQAQQQTGTPEEETPEEGQY